ncbi:MAG TPA: aminotransferase class V-fold PLP-dependent enzyme [Bryobacteraceae bacterium]|nr:aminotransferase class V-fold PLP-dependent enzyme [Bryobacteraceae bacterium]
MKTQISRRGFVGASGVAAFSSLAAPTPAAAAGDDDPLGVRKDFPATGDWTYLNTAYIGLISQSVVDAARDFAEARARRPYSVGQMLAKTDQARKLFSEMVGAGQDEIGFLFSTSEGENVVVNSLDFKPGDNIVFDDIAYPSTPVIYRRLEKTHGVEMRVVKNRKGAGTVEDFAKLVDKRTRIISVAWVSNTSGHRHDMQGLANLAHAHGAYLYADAVQFIGTAPLDVRAVGVDFFTTGTYKWLMAGFGVAPFYVRRELLDRIQPGNVGWMVEKSLPNYEYQHYRTARKFEYSSPAFGQLYELAAALAYLKRIGLDKIEAQSENLTAQLRKGLAGRGFSVFTPEGNHSSIVSFYTRKAPGEIQKILDAERIKVSLQQGSEDGVEAGMVRIRVAPAFFNNAAEIKRFLKVSEQLIAV